MRTHIQNTLPQAQLAGSPILKLLARLLHSVQILLLLNWSEAALSFRPG